MNKAKIGWGIMAFLVFLLLCGLSVPLGIVSGWWASAAFVGGVLVLGGIVHLAIWLTE